MEPLKENVSKSITYFKRYGSPNTEETLNLVKERALELGIKDILIASEHGRTALKAVKVFEGTDLRVICVQNSASVLEQTEGVIQHLPEFEEGLRSKNNKKLKELGVPVLQITAAFWGIDQTILFRRGGWSPGSVIADTLRIFGQGMKVVNEIAVMAADAGYVTVGEEAISVAGTHAGVDTAIVVVPVNSWRFFECEIREIICIPRQRLRNHNYDIRSGKVNQYYENGNLAEIIIDIDKCTGCGLCLEGCAMGVYEIVDKKVKVVNQNMCWACTTCEDMCPVDAITLELNEPTIHPARTPFMK